MSALENDRDPFRCGEAPAPACTPGRYDGIFRACVIGWCAIKAGLLVVGAAYLLTRKKPGRR